MDSVLNVLGSFWISINLHLSLGSHGDGGGGDLGQDWIIVPNKCVFSVIRIKGQ